MFKQDWKILAVTSPLEGAGKTVTATNLAITAAAHSGQSIYLIDFDLKNPSIGQCLGLPMEGKDLCAHVDGDASFSEISFDIGFGSLTVIPAAEKRRNSSEIITSRQVFGLLTNILVADVDPLIIMDLPPVLSHDDALAISPIVDAFLLVVAEGETARDDVARTFEMLSDANVIGTVLNKSHNT